MTLAEYLGAAVRAPFAWDGLNCLTFAADWAQARRGVDLAEGFRGRVKTRLGAVRFLNRHGGLLAFAAARAEACGLAATEAPAPGDIGVVEAPGLDGRRVQAGAICAGRRWAMLGARGLTFAEAAPLDAWRI